ACTAYPNAVITLVQLLRVSGRLDVGGALVAESLAYSTLLGGAEFARWRGTSDEGTSPFGDNRDSDGRRRGAHDHAEPAGGSQRL
ncbi:MAG: hypothetical protein M3Q30_12270, partial [Actinomycetota bacterium]|nr:hypothetical protein [Actinomycetota bacterium]